MGQDSNAASSAVLEPQYVAPKEVEDLTSEERANWLKTGDLPPKEQPVAESAPKPAADKSGKKPESGTGEEDRRDRNWRELRQAREASDKRVAELEAELAELRKPKPAEEKKPEPTPAAGGLPKEPERPSRPRMKDHLTSDGTLDSDKYEAALDKYEQDLSEFQPKYDAWRKSNEAFENWKKETTARTEKVNGSWKGIAAKAKELIPDWDQLSSSAAAREVIQIGDPIERYCRDLADEGRPDTAARLVEYLLRKPDDLKRIQGLSAKKQMEEYAALEVAILDELSGKSEEKSEEPKPERKLTSAGKPPSEPGGGTSSPEDDGSPQAAFKRKDLTQEQRGELYRERQNKLERDRRKAGRAGRR